MLLLLQAMHTLLALLLSPPVLHLLPLDVCARPSASWFLNLVYASMRLPPNCNVPFASAVP